MKKISRIAAIIVAVSMLTLCASAFSVSGGGEVEDTFTVDVISTADGEVAGSFDVSTTGGVSLARVAPVDADLATNVGNSVGIVSLDASVGDVLATITFNVTGAGEYTITFTGDQDSFAGINGAVTGIVVGEIEGGEENNTGGGTNPPTGVAVAVVPALIAAAAAVISRKRA